MLAVAQLPRLLAASPRLLAAPRGDGRVVIDVPGWRAPESSGAPIRTYLRYLGHDSRGWGIGTNTGAVRRDVARLADRVAELADEFGRKVALVGWSLGGVISREIARTHPEAVHRVITYGSPIIGGPSFTAAAASYSAAETEQATRESARLDSESPISVPVTAIFTRRDGVVDWRACIDRSNPRVEHIEVDSTHIGLGVDPDVWRVVAERLAA
ncbi:alpha/beta hydrolase [Thermoleophilia bacterium SCSIO 60948]|nr:alpha/beta hydrolase [Thermoleophilia bacterium SCSIO 60948]